MITGNATIKEAVRAGEEAAEVSAREGCVAVPHGAILRAVADAADRTNVTAACEALYLSRFGADLAAVWRSEPQDDGTVPMLGLMTTLTHRHGPKFFAGAADADQAGGGVVYASWSTSRGELATARGLKDAGRAAVDWWVKRQKELPALRRLLKSPLADPGTILFAATRKPAGVMDNRTPILPVYRARMVHLNFADQLVKDHWSLALAFMRVEGRCNPKLALPRGLDFYHLLRDGLPFGEEDARGGNAQAEPKRVDRVRRGGRASHRRRG